MNKKFSRAISKHQTLKRGAMKKIIFFLFLILVLAGCKGEDGSDGKVFVKMQWTSDINAIDLSDVFEGDYPSVFYQNTPYEITPRKSGTIGWRSGTTWYVLPVNAVEPKSGESGSSEYLVLPKNGDDGKDTIMSIGLSGDTFYFLGTTYQSIFGEPDANVSIPSGKAIIEESLRGNIVRDN